MGLLSAITTTPMRCLLTPLEKVYVCLTREILLLLQKSLGAVLVTSLIVVVLKGLFMQKNSISSAGFA